MNTKMYLYLVRRKPFPTFCVRGRWRATPCPNQAQNALAHRAWSAHSTWAEKCTERLRQHRLRMSACVFPALRYSPMTVAESSFFPEPSLFFTSHTNVVFTVSSTFLTSSRFWSTCTEDGSWPDALRKHQHRKPSLKPRWLISET